MATMNVHILSRKFIRPSTPTPPNLRDYKLSFADELAPTMNVPLILYYPPNTNGEANNNILRCTHLEKSLEKILTRFYPFAGRFIKSTCSVDCNDQGVEYVVARAETQLIELIGQGAKLKTELLDYLIPCDIGAADEIIDPVLGIQVTMFKCGGLVIGLCYSHRICDGSTISMFLDGWATVGRSESVEPICPSFNSVGFFPRKNLPELALRIPRTKNNVEFIKSVTRKFSFNRKAISTLRDMVGVKDSGRRQCSGLQLVNAVIWKAIMDIDRAKHECSRATFVIQPVNLRGKGVPPILQNTFGNLWGLATAQCSVGECDEMEFQNYVDLLSESIKNAVRNSGKILLDGEDGHMIVINSFTKANENLLNSEVNFCLFTSWCKFPFYEADFGWGRPIWASTSRLPLKNVVILMDAAEGDGIEAWVYLEERDMANLEQDSNIRAFST